MKFNWEEALRSLARKSHGPFRGLAYGVTHSLKDQSALEADLGCLLKSEAQLSGGMVFAEVGDPFSGATQRPRFKKEVLSWIRRPAPCASPGRTVPADSRTPENALRARERLEAVAANLAGYLDQFDRAFESGLSLGAGVESPGPKPASQDRKHWALPPEPPARAARPKDSESREIPVILVRRFEALGSDAEGIAASAGSILCRGSHLMIHSEGLDTRTREGRMMAGILLRVGGIKADQARARSLRELSRRREGLQVYGPVPFGFIRRGQELVPVPPELETVARLRELSRRALTLLETALTLNREGRLWKDGTPWTWRRVRHVLHNTIYDRSFVTPIPQEVSA